MQETNFVSTNAGTSTMFPSVVFTRRFSEKVISKTPIGSEAFFAEQKESDSLSTPSNINSSDPKTFTANHKLKFMIVS